MSSLEEVCCSAENERCSFKQLLGRSHTFGWAQRMSETVREKQVGGSGFVCCCVVPGDSVNAAGAVHEASTPPGWRRPASCWLAETHAQQLNSVRWGYERASSSASSIAFGQSSRDWTLCGLATDLLQSVCQARCHNALRLYATPNLAALCNHPLSQQVLHKASQAAGHAAGGEACTSSSARQQQNRLESGLRTRQVCSHLTARPRNIPMLLPAAVTTRLTSFQVDSRVSDGILDRTHGVAQKHNTTHIPSTSFEQSYCSSCCCCCSYCVCLVAVHDAAATLGSI